MPRDREPPTAFDLAVVALSPALIMGLVGSLGYFLLEVLYAGDHDGRLRWTLFFFVFGIVLVCRIALTMDPGKAFGYGLVLCGAVFLAMGKFLESPLGSVANLVILGVVWWSADRLVKDCTRIDEFEDDAGRGLMQEVTGDRTSEPDASATARGRSIADASGSEKRKAHPPGRWVVYFSLAALPLFGIGQSLIPAADTGRRQYAFWLMTTYVGSGLGLLVTTSLLAMRRYLRQKRLQMPTSMTTLWLGVGAALVLAFLIVGALLPRPHSEYPLVSITPAGSRSRDASRLAQRGDDAGKGEGKAMAKGEDKGAKDGSGGKGQAGGKNAGKSGKAEGGDGKGKAKGKDGKGDAKGGNSGKGEDGKSESKDSGDSSGSGSDSSSTPPSVSPPDFLGSVANFIKWVVIAVLIVAALAFAGWFLLKHYAQFGGWTQKLFDWLSALFGASGSRSAEPSAEEEVVAKPRPFAEFSNPFADGSASHQTPDALVRYSFSALDAWAAEQTSGRRQDETPLEFAERVSGERPGLEDEARRLAQLYARLAYARRAVPEAGRAQVERFWDALERASESPVGTP